MIRFLTLLHDRHHVSLFGESMSSKCGEQSKVPGTVCSSGRFRLDTIHDDEPG